MRAPLAPMGWPSATAPPFTLTFSGLSLSWRVTAIAATANASFSSTRSTSLSRSQPVLASSFSTASTGASSNRAVFLERGLELRERFEGSIFAGRFVIFDDEGIAFFLRNFDGENLRFEEAGFARAHGLLVAFDSEAILFLARNAIFFRDQFAGQAHVKIFVRVPQAVV